MFTRSSCDTEYTVDQSNSQYRVYLELYGGGRAGSDHPLAVLAGRVLRSSTVTHCKTGGAGEDLGGGPAGGGEGAPGGGEVAAAHRLQPGEEPAPADGAVRGEDEPHAGPAGHHRPRLGPPVRTATSNIESLLILCISI